jgi:ATP-dependent DNA helicase PIF1
MIQLTSCQQSALELLETDENIFLTGVAGSGKSYLISQFLKKKRKKQYPVLASTGAAALLIGGRTFHSFFGLGIMEGSEDDIIEKALSDRRVKKRLNDATGLVIDEISMITGYALTVAQEIARMARDDNRPWGGLRIVAVGDFAQLPPVSRGSQQKDWVFNSYAWNKTHFVPVCLTTVVRNDDAHFNYILNLIRSGEVTDEVEEFLNSRLIETDYNLEDGTHLFPLRRSTESFNLKRLQDLDGEIIQLPTTYWGNERYIKALKKNAPIPETIVLKPGALVMVRQNDPRGRWINGSQGYFDRTIDDKMGIELLNGRYIELPHSSFSLLDGDGKAVATATNYPVNLAYASTIHKAQGATLDRVTVDMQRLWEPGQAYVALSRVRNPNNIQILSWDPSSFRISDEVQEFYTRIGLDIL